jgi:hypothetical protein
MASNFSARVCHACHAITVKFNTTDDSNLINLSNFFCNFVTMCQPRRLHCHDSPAPEGSHGQIYFKTVSSPKYESFATLRMVDYGEMSRYSVQCPRESRFEKKGEGRLRLPRQIIINVVARNNNNPDRKLTGHVSLVGLSLKRQTIRLIIPKNCRLIYKLLDVQEIEISVAKELDLHQMGRKMMH